MQGITQTHFERILHTFIASNKHVYHWRRKRLSLGMNVFMPGEERICH